METNKPVVQQTHVTPLTPFTFRTLIRENILPIIVLALVLPALCVGSFLFATSPVVASSTAPLSIQSLNNWNSTVIGLTSSGNQDKLVVNNFNPANGVHVKLLATNPPATTVLDSVAPNGKNLLYQIPNQKGKTLYFTLTPLSGTDYFYKLADGNAGNAIWETDNLHVLIATVNNGVLEVNIQTGSVTNRLSSLSLVVPTFYSQGYMYFTGGQNPSYNSAELYRVDISSGAVQQVTSFPSIDAIYWLDPTGSTIYFANKIGPGGQSGIYSVSASGQNLQLIRMYADARPVGFAADNALEFMRDVNNQFQLWKLGASAQKDTVVVKNVAPKASELCSTPVNPGITPICESNIALAPQGHGLIVLALYTSGRQKMWSDTISTGKQFVLFKVPGSTQVQLPGWDRLTV